MIIAGLVTGAKRGILYIRHELPSSGRNSRRRDSALLSRRASWQKILGSDLDYDLEVFVSPGGYICGEESALIEAIEGHRG